MAPTTVTPTRDAIVTAIRLEQRRGVATESTVLQTAAAFADVDADAVATAFDQLRKEGEIYTYPGGGERVVRITNEVLA